MSGGDSNCSRLCRLIDESLRPYTEPEVVVSLTRETEKGILVALSKVLKEVQLWTGKLTENADNGTVVESASNSECSGGSSSHSEEHHCLTKIVSNLIVLLTLESQYVQHLTGNVLSFISEFLAASESDWYGFIHLVCVCMELAITNTCTYPSAPSTSGPEDSNSDSSNFYAFIQPRLKNANWSTVAGIFRVLRKILKYLKQDYNDQLLEVYLDSLDSCLSNVRWDLLDEIHFSQKSHKQESFCADALFLRNISGLQEPRIMFLGIFLQLLCSLVDQSDYVEAAGGSIEKHPIHFKIINLVPKVLYWCLGKQEDYVDACISQYFKHKLLVLMTRLSFQTCLGHSILVSWLQLLHAYFQELLWQPIAQPESGQDDCLEGSPFLLSVSDVEVHNLHSCHIQRQAIFLFLKCSLTLISLRADTDKQCVCATPNSCLTYESNLDLECCCRKKGLLELYKWLQGHLPTEMFLDHQMYSERCLNFASSFLQLYMHEDDILFKVLLQLLSVPFCAEQRLPKEKGMFQDVKEDILFHVSNLFNPIHLFHLFLSELHYDHQVVLDYLISKDTGISCAEYLLRSLRIVCNSWCIFEEFSVDGEVIDQSPCKKRKFLSDGSNFSADVTPTIVENDAILTSLEECNGYHKYGCKDNRTQPFDKAKECLLSLRNSVESLHKKNLFPYNPKVLLKRLTRFQELCFKEEKYYLSISGGII